MVTMSDRRPSTVDDDRLRSIEAKLDALIQRGAGLVPLTLTVEGAAAYSSLSVESIRRLLISGKLTGLRPVAGRVLIAKQELDAYLLSATSMPRKRRGVYDRNGED